MTFTKLQLLLQNDELHYISDSSQFFIDNHIKMSLAGLHDFILFENTIHDWNNTLQTLTDNNIDFTIYTDSYNLDYILI